ncbi:MAG: ABC transporter substrate-binding protein, partial [Desulfobacula sp.]|nr:ABC transporter substrate-binding protein [Desulfobacula sp.]
MKGKKKLVLLITAALFVGMSFLTNPALAEGKVYKWKMATSWPPGIPLYRDMAEVFAKHVE